MEGAFVTVCGLFAGRWWRFEVVVLLGFLGGVDVARGYVPGDAVSGVDGPLFFVHEVMVVAAQECAVAGISGAVV